MKIAIHSDLHLEGNSLPDEFAEDTDTPDVVILAGDIGVRHLHVDLFTIRQVYGPEPVIIFVPGNHEYYGFDFHERNEGMKKICELNDILFLVAGNGIIVGDTYFIGSTCWSDMSSIRGAPSPQDKAEVESGVSDFRMIRNGSSRWSADDMIARSIREKREIEALLHNAKGDPSLKTVLISHFPLLLEVANPIFPKDAFTSYFHNDWSDLILKYEPTAVVYGHNHYNSPVDRYGQSLLLSNQRGYNKEASNKTYNPNYLVEI